MSWAKRQLSEPTVIRLEERGSQAGWYFLMNRETDVCASNSHPYATLSALLAVWDVELGRHDRDQWGAFIVANPRRKGER